jgi:hypothetical protein
VVQGAFVKVGVAFIKYLLLRCLLPLFVALFVTISVALSVAISVALSVALSVAVCRYVLCIPINRNSTWNCERINIDKQRGGRMLGELKR